MVVELVQIKKVGKESFRLSSIYVNPQHIVFLSEDKLYKSYLSEGRIQIGLNKSTIFTKIKLNEGNKATDVIVIGDPQSVQSKLFKSKAKMLLKD